MAARDAGWRSRWGPALALMAVIFVASSIPGEDLPDAGTWDRLFKKGGHFIGYALLGAFYLRGLSGGRRPTAREVGKAVLLAALYAATDEFHQRFTPGRRAAVADVLLDTAGATLGSALGAWWARRATGRT